MWAYEDYLTRGDSSYPLLIVAAVYNGTGLVDGSPHALLVMQTTDADSVVAANQRTGTLIFAFLVGLWPVIFGFLWLDKKRRR